MKLLTLHGVEHMAGRHLATDRASEFSVVAQARRRHCRRTYISVTVLVVGVTISGYVIVQSGHNRTYQLNQEFSPSRGFSMIIMIIKSGRTVKMVELTRAARC
jgi:hypothetical protein